MTVTEQSVPHELLLHIEDVSMESRCEEKLVLPFKPLLVDNAEVTLLKIQLPSPFFHVALLSMPPGGLIVNPRITDIHLSLDPTLSYQNGQGWWSHRSGF